MPWVPPTGPDRDDPGRDPVRDGVQLMAAGMFAEIAGYHGETDLARTLLGDLAKAAGDDPYAVTVATSFEARTAAVVGDRRAGLCVPPTAGSRSTRTSPSSPSAPICGWRRCWARAMSGARARGRRRRGRTAHPRQPRRVPSARASSTWYALLAEMRIAAGSLDGAAAALDRADDCLERYGQRSAEALVILVRAQLARATADDRTAVRAGRAGAGRLRSSRRPTCSCSGPSGC